MPEGHRVRVIRATSPFFRTRQGISTADNLSTIKRRFPGVRAIGTYYEARQRVVVYDDKQRGIGFDVARVAGQSDSSSRCVAITVHSIGSSALDQYLPLHPNFKPL